ncbi:MAG: PDZ domain-containing protein, partial [Planctomycetes bacterium]|nr:PDZ domain-containing protein [Planctomycetota bacterium]
FAFSVRRTRDWSAVRQVSFDQGWRAMRDRFYDPDMNNRDWDAIRAKYRPVAAQCLGQREFTDLMNLMLGELNASHMGHRGGSDAMPRTSSPSSWAPVTHHLGLRYELARPAKGLVVSSVIPESPCDRARSKVRVGEILLAIDGNEIGPTTDVDALLTMDETRDVVLTVAGQGGSERQVTVRPTRSVAGLLYDEFVANNRRRVDELSDGKLGYLHIRGMNMSSFRQMEQDLYDAGFGKDGLIIDVRFNGGGSTTDHVLTALTQPMHAITKSRGSGEGYPQDRKVYASWHKPIVLMCNEHSFSNAEILSHAVKQIGRGRLVGMRTAGGVISTGSVGLLDGSSVRMPMRGWYLASTGDDMELNGCLPDIALWNHPMGPDEQLRTAVETLTEDVQKEQARGSVKIVPAATKRRLEKRAAEASGGKRK